jgi:hypothetical protein
MGFSPSNNQADRVYPAGLSFCRSPSFGRRCYLAEIMNFSLLAERQNFDVDSLSRMG